MKRVGLLVLLLICGTLWVGQVGAEGSVSLAGAGAKEMVWVTIGEDVFDLLRRQPNVLRHSQRPTAYETRAGVVITRLSPRDFHDLSLFVHAEKNRCAGFMAHDSLEAAQAMVRGADRTRYSPLLVDFEVNQQTLVQQLLPDVTEANILTTIQDLSTDYNNRYYLNASGEQSALWIRDLWQGYAAGRSDVTVATVSHSGYVQPSVVLTIQGTTSASEVVVLGGHLDSIVSGGVNANTLAPGADDNASGIATLSEIIRVLMDNNVQPARTLKFMGYAAEEVGLRGSGDIAQQHVNDNTDVVAVLQFDMTAFNGSAEDFALSTDFTNSQLTDFLGLLIDTYLPNQQWTTSACGYACSDHASWHNRGFPAAFPFEAKFGEHNQAIHSSNDTVQTFGGTAAHAFKFARLGLSFALETAMGVGSGNAAPVVGITAPADGSSADLGTSVSFAGTATDAEDGTLSSSLSWSSSLDGNIGSGASFSTSSLTQGSHTITTSVTDSGGLSGNASIALTIEDPNTNGPQTAVYDSSLGAPRCGIVGSSCDSTTLLVGRNSKGPEPNQPNTLGSCSDGNSGSFHSDESNDQIVVSMVGNGDFTAGATVKIDATVWAYSSFGSDHLDLYYAADANNPSWVFIATLEPTQAGAQTLSTNYTLPTGSLQTVRANFRYNGSASSCGSGNYDDTDDLVFAVGGGAANTAPTASISAPSDGTSVTQGASVAFAGSANDNEDGNLSANLSWSSSLDGSIGSGASFSTTSLSVGSHTVTASVSDSGGLSASAQVDVTVNAPANTAPTVLISAPSNGTSVTQGASVIFTGSANDNEDGNLSSNLSWSSSLDGNIGSGASFSTNSLSLGNHTVTASVTDSGGLSDSAQVSVTVTSGGGSNGPQDAVYNSSLGVPSCLTAGSSCDSGTLLVGRNSKGPEPNQPNTLGSACNDGNSGSFHNDESNDKIVVSTLNGADFSAGATVKIDATVWAWSTGLSDHLDLYYAADANNPSWVFIATLDPSAGGEQTLSVNYTLPSGSLQAIRANFRYQGSASSCTSGNYNDHDDLVFAVNP